MPRGTTIVYLYAQSTELYYILSWHFMYEYVPFQRTVTKTAECFPNGIRENKLSAEVLVLLLTSDWRRRNLSRGSVISSGIFRSLIIVAVSQVFPHRQDARQNAVQSYICCCPLRKGYAELKSWTLVCEASFEQITTEYAYFYINLLTLVLDRNF